MTDQELAEAIRDFYVDHPDAGAPVVADALDVDYHDVVRILDSWLVADGVVSEVGVGGGGGWVAPAELLAAAPIQIGFRHPNGELRDEPPTGPDG